MEKEISSSVDDLVDTTEDTIKTFEHTVDSMAESTRKSLLKRFPTLFTLLVTFGVATTFLGFEQIVIRTPFLFSNPIIMLVIGVGILVLTGTLYKKL